MVEWLGTTSFRIEEPMGGEDELDVTLVNAVYRDEDGAINTVTLDEDTKTEDDRYNYDHVGVASDYRDRDNLVAIEAREDDGRFLWRSRPLVDEEDEEDES